MNDKLSPYLCGFRKGYNTQYCLMVMLEKSIKKVAGALLTDLFNCLHLDLLIAKLEAYGFGHSSLILIYNYLSGRKQRTKVNNIYSEWNELETGVPQGSILGPLIFNIYINDIFYFVNEDTVANFADDNTPYTIQNNIETLLNNLQSDSHTLLMWFDNNFLKLNADKCKLLVTKHEDEVSITLDKEVIKGNKTVKHLGIKIDNKLDFNEHISNIYKKASLELHALARIAPYMNKEKLRILMKTFIDAQFNYCPLIWMFHSRTLNNKINKLHERALRLVYKDYISSFENLLNIDNTFTIHERNLQKLAKEMYKIKNNLSPSFLIDIFPQSQNPYELRNKNICKTENIHTVFYGCETVSFRGPKTWALIPDNIKNYNNLNEFKAKIKSWKPEGCACRICKVYVQNLGFIS